jgi:hypothetical protein
MADTVATFDEQITHALNRALATLQAHVESDLGSLTQEFVAAAEIARKEAAREAADAALTDERRHAEEQISEVKDKARAELAALRLEMEAQLDEATRLAHAATEEARRAADIEASTLREKVVALEAELDVTRRQGQLEAENAANRRLAAEVERTRTDAYQAELSSTVSLLNGIRSIDDARSLGEVLSALAQCAGREAERAGVLIVKGDTLRGWRFSGFTPDMLQQPGSVMLARDEAGIVSTVAAKGAADTVSPVPSADDSALPAFARGAGKRQAVAMPIAVGGEVVAVLYADAVRSDAPSAVCRWPAVLEVLVRHTSRALEALTVQQAAGLAVPMRTAPVVRKPLPGPLEHGGTGDEDAARRYARLLVSEIRMYHEPTVDAARRTRDLRARLGGEIERARRLYEERIPPDVRQTGDYFEQELVRTLADGDRTVLG